MGVGAFNICSKLKALLFEEELQSVERNFRNKGEKVLLYRLGRDDLGAVSQAGEGDSQRLVLNVLLLESSSSSRRGGSNRCELGTSGRGSSPDPLPRGRATDRGGDPR